MAGRTGVPPASAFVGRARELELIAEAAGEAAAGKPRVVWIEGGAGSGKTTLLRQALSRLAENFVIIRGQADEFASDVAYELVGQLGATTSEGTFATGMELLGVWSRRQEEGPIAVVVENLHWADKSSAQALLTAVRRLDEDRVLIIVTSRSEPVTGWERIRMDRDLCRLIVLGAFSVEDVVALAALEGVELSHREAARLHEHTTGQPIWVRTLLSEIDPAVLRSRAGELPAPRSLASAVTARVSELPPSARALIAALSVLDRRSPLPLVGQVAGIGEPVVALEDLIVTGFVRFEPNEAGPPLEFSHPLYRQAIYRDLSPTVRRDLHRAAAEALTPATAIPHRVAAADGTDEGLAEELEAEATKAVDEGAIAIAARNLLWASSLTADAHRSERLLLDGAQALVQSGQFARAESLRHEVESCSESAARDLVLGLIDWELGRSDDAQGWFRRAVEAPDSRPLDLAKAWAQLAEAQLTVGNAEKALESSARALELAPEGSSAERLAWLTASLAAALHGGGPAGLEVMRRRLPENPEEIAANEVDLLVARAMIGLYSSRNSRALEDARVVLRLARQGHVPVQLSRCHFIVATLLVAKGEWDQALVHARTANSVAEDDQLVWMTAQCHSVLGTVLAYRGEWDGAELEVSRANDAASAHEMLEAVATARLATAALATARGEPERVVEALIDFQVAVPMLGALAFWPTLVVALIDAGRAAEAAEQIEKFAEAAALRGLDLEARVTALRARLAAAENRPDDAGDLFEKALSSFSADDPYLEVALVHHAYGKFLNAKGDRRAGVDHLRKSHDLLSAVGAQPFVARVEVDLGTSGIRAAAGTSRSALELTERERDVALLVAQGMTNPEVASELYVSRKAVEYHLSNIYGKLGISSRKELRNLKLPA